MQAIELEEHVEVLTTDGFRRVEDLVERDSVPIWNGMRFVTTRVKRLREGRKQRILAIQLTNGDLLDCRSSHRFEIYGPGGEVMEMEAGSLRPGVVLVPVELPVIATSTSEIPADSLDSPPYLRGLAASDFQQRSNRPSALGLVPGVDHSVEARTFWLEGLVDGQDEDVIFNDPEEMCICLRIKATDREFLLDVKRMLNTLGTHSVVCVEDAEQPTFGLRIYPRDVWHLCTKVDFRPKHVDLLPFTMLDAASRARRPPICVQDVRVLKEDSGSCVILEPSEF